MQRNFVRQFSSSAARTHDAYVVGRNAYVIIPPDLKIALDVVRAKRRAGVEERRAFLRNPRVAIADALESSGREAGPLFIETSSYSERVEGLGIWQEIALPPTRRTGGWMPENFAGAVPAGVESQQRECRRDWPCRRGGRGGRPHRSDDRRGAGSDRADPRRARRVPRSPPGRAEGQFCLKARLLLLAEPIEESPKLGLVIKTNVDGVEYETPRRPRKPLIECEFPHDHMSTNRPKAHQLEGFAWLVEAWRRGWPGVLLADDMGLGKTYQALAFLSWMRGNQAARGRHHPTAPALGPMMVVAPTALLRNWRAEAERHLTGDGLGEVVEAFGSGLRRLKRPKDADWSADDSIDPRSAALGRMDPHHLRDPRRQSPQLCARSLFRRRIRRDAKD